MKGDFTRDTFDPLRHFSRVLMQQGRVQLDADFNEQASILLYYLRTAISDIIGPYGAVGNGFMIVSPPKDASGDALKIPAAPRDRLNICRGHYYVDGILCENEEDLYIDKAELEAAKGQLQQGNPCLYLDVWERHITYVQDDRIREVALGGPDTCTRSKIVWRIRIGQISENIPVEAWIRQLPRLSTARIRARVHPEQSDNNICTIPPESRYRGAENQLYRIEIHRGGVAWKDATDPGGNSSGNATFKWSRDNGSVVFPIVRQQGAVATLLSLGRDERTGLKVGDWVEITDDEIELRGEPGIMAQVDKVDPLEMQVTLNQLEGGASWPEYDEKTVNKHPLVRRWDQRAKEGLTLSMGAIPITESADPSSGWIEIEDGIEVQFTAPGRQADAKETRSYRTGDYWLIPARVATGKIEWPETGEASGLPPHGVEHHYAPLAVMKDGIPDDQRPKFEPLAKSRI